MLKRYIKLMKFAKKPKRPKSTHHNLRKRRLKRTANSKKQIENTKKLLINIAGVLTAILIIVLVKNLLITPKKDVNIPLERVAALQVPHRVLIEIKELSAKYGMNFVELLTLYCIENDFFPSKSITPPQPEIEQNFIMNFEKIKKQYKQNKVEPYNLLFEGVFNELKCFPIPEEYAEEEMFGDSWGSDRTYKGERKHEGTDILDRENVRGRIPIVSMTSGTIKNIGWNELGGYRIGIVSESGNYYYYAHFDSFSKDLKQGDRVSAGQFLGYMGDSGYGKEGTKGNFVVHLHIGICLKTELTKKEFWVNPYPFLRYVEYNRVESLYDSVSPNSFQNSTY